MRLNRTRASLDMRTLWKIPEVLRFIWTHPLSRDRRVARLQRYIAWQLGARLVPGPVLVPFVENCRLVARPGMQGATGNVYTGLHEFNEMAFVLHCLREQDLFLDVGANIGAYTLLAAAVVGCRAIAIEPIEATFRELTENIWINRASQRVATHAVALGERNGEIQMTDSYGAMNRVVGFEEAASISSSTIAPMRTMDELLAGQSPSFIKIDVEGFEPQVLAGGRKTLEQPSLLAVLMETDPNVARNDGLAGAAQIMQDLGFVRYRYDGLTRRLEPIRRRDSIARNTIFARSAEPLRDRVRASRRYRVLDVEV
jgi:FkbM family methyltransferase